MIKKNNFKKMDTYLTMAVVLIVIIVLCLPFGSLASKQTSQEQQWEQGQTIRGKVLSISRNMEKEQMAPDLGEGYSIIYQDVETRILAGKHKGETVIAENIIDERFIYKLIVEEGDEVLIYVDEDHEGRIIEAYVADIYRQKHLSYLLALFLIVLVVFGRAKGLKTIITLALTGLAILKLLLPGLLAGYDPILLTVIICAGITALTLFVVSGINKKTIAAIIGTTGGVLAAGLIAMIFGTLTKLSGLGEHETQMLAFIPQGNGFDFTGLLFAGIIIGSLGAVMDVGMSISSALHEMEIIKPDISTKKLISAGMNVGRDIMGTMANTLILAYTGASLPLLLLFMANAIPAQQFLNWDMISSEIVRALAGSIGLILTIPLTTIVSAALRDRKRVKSGNQL
ncbi:MAG: YibE/F family protein [Peptococcaceae bacterium]|nr:YibE/F family protein [Peptococcaceae bacterium]